MKESLPIQAETCISCGSRLMQRGDATFRCPACRNEPMGRCKRCRDQSAPYLCPECGWRGP